MNALDVGCVREDTVWQSARETNNWNNEEMMPGMKSEHYRSIMRHQAGAVTVIATGPVGERAGLTATAVASVSDTPPALLVCVGRKTGAHDVITRMRAFSVNLLSREQQAVADRFAGRDGVSGEDRFRAVDGDGGVENTGHWGVGESGVPVLSHALATLECKLTDQHAFSTHSIFIGHVLGGVFQADAAPLLYFRGDYWDVGAR